MCAAHGSRSSPHDQWSERRAASHHSMALTRRMQSTDAVTDASFAPAGDGSCHTGYKLHFWRATPRRAPLHAKAKAFVEHSFKVTLGRANATAAVERRSGGAVAAGTWASCNGGETSACYLTV